MVNRNVLRLEVVLLGLALLLSACQSVQGAVLAQATPPNEASQQSPTNQQVTDGIVHLAEVEPTFERELVAQLSRQLEALAAELSTYLAQNEDRSFLATQLRAAPKTNAVVLREVLAADAAQRLASDDDRLFRLASHVQQAEMIINQLGMPIPRLDLTLYMPADSTLLEDSDTLYVAVSPLADESEVQSVTAYANGQRLSLSASDPPTVPTLVIAPAEREDLEPTYPLTTVQEPGDEPNSERIIDDFVGISHMLITNDHEPWHKFDAEIEVRFRRWLKWPGVFKDEKVALPSVDDEDELYALGDPNDTYLYIDNKYQPSIEVAVWETDSDSGDDFVGVLFLNWPNLDFAGYTGPLSNGDVRIYVDRD